MTQVTENKGRWYSLLVTGAGGRHRREVLRLRVPALRAKEDTRDTPLPSYVSAGRMTQNAQGKCCPPESRGGRYEVKVGRHGKT
jgi:hypothetical protein